MLASAPVVISVYDRYDVRSRLWRRSETPLLAPCTARGTVSRVRPRASTGSYRPRSARNACATGSRRTNSSYSIPVLCDGRVIMVGSAAAPSSEDQHVTHPDPRSGAPTPPLANLKSGSSKAPARMQLNRSASSTDRIARARRGSRMSRPEEAFAREEDFSSAADAFSSIAIISTLIFGFALSSFVALAGLAAEITARPRVAAFAILMVLTSGLSGFATIFMTLTYYYLKRLDSQDSRLRRFYERTASGRRAARQSTWSSLVVYLSSLALLSFEMLPLWAAIVCTLLVGAGAIVMLLTTTMLHHYATEDPPSAHESELSGVSLSSTLERTTTLSRPTALHVSLPSRLSRGPSAKRIVGIHSPQAGSGRWSSGKWAVESSSSTCDHTAPSREAAAPDGPI